MLDRWYEIIDKPSMRLVKVLRKEYLTIRVAMMKATEEEINELEELEKELI